MRCPYCGKRIAENGNICEHCGKDLTLFSKFKGQHVRKKDILQIDTFVAFCSFVLMIITLFLPICTLSNGEGTTEFTMMNIYKYAGEQAGRSGTQVWALVLFLVFIIISFVAWFWGEKSYHYFWMSMSGTIGSILLCIVTTVFMMACCAYYGFYSMSLSFGYILWIIGLCVQAVALILYRWRTKCLIKKEIGQTQPT